MACGGALSPVNLIAGAGLITNTALAVNSDLVSNLSNFDSLNVTSQFSDVVTSATGILNSGTLDSLRTLGADTFPALTNALPSSVASALSVVAPGGIADGGFSGLINNMASNIMGDGDLTRFTQIFNQSQAWAGQANQFVNSYLNSGDLAQTFGSITGGMDNLITGSFNQVSQAFGALGGDLNKLGSLIDMNNLSNLGDPSALVRQLTSVGGLTGSVESTLRQIGLSNQDISQFGLGGFTSIADSANKLLYEGMTKITGNELLQIKDILNITTPNINNMADLLDPKKIFPSSFQTLTTPTPDGLRGIYVNAAGTVNSNLEKYVT